MRKKIRTVSLAMALGLFAFGSASYAQDAPKTETKTEKKEGKVKIVIENNGEKKVFERSFEGEMPEDVKKDLEQFMKENGKGDNMNFNFDMPDMKDMPKFEFKTDDKMMFFKGTDGLENFEFKFDPKALEEMMENFKGMEIPEMKEGDFEMIFKDMGEMKDMQIEMEKELEKIKKSMPNMQDFKVIEEEKDGQKVIRIEGLPNNGENKSGTLLIEHLGEDENKDVIIINGEKLSDKDLEKMRNNKGGIEVFSFQSSDNGGKTVEMVKCVVLISGNMDDQVQRKTKKNVDIVTADNVELKVYPNPSSGKFSIKLDGKEKANTSIEVFDMAGKEVFSKQLNEFSGVYKEDIDLSGRKGTYIVKVSQDGKSFTQKLLVQ